jgi:hypothetical protein
MKKRQKWLIWSKIFFLLAIILVIIQLLWQKELIPSLLIKYDFPIFGWTSIITFFLSIILYLIIGGPLGIGVPNNSYKEFKKLSTMKFQENGIMEIEEIERDCWQITTPYSDIRFNMKGWVFQRQYIYELICLSLIIRENNKTDSIVLKLLKKQKCQYKNIRLVFKSFNGKCKARDLVKNWYICKSLRIYFRIISCFEGDRRHGLNIPNLTKHNHLSLENYYHFYD